MFFIAVAAVAAFLLDNNIGIEIIFNITLIILGPVKKRYRRLHLISRTAWTTD
jgi:hypothetical protein